ncbi:unnamed protein product [Closterium sp. NIES-53]
MKTAEVAPMATTIRTTDAVADGSKASVILATRADICGTIATNSLINGLLLKAKRVEEQREGEEEAVAVAEAMFKGADGKMVGLKNVLWVPNLAANLISVRRLQKAGMDTSSKGANTYTARIGKRVLWDVHEDRDVYNEMWQVPLVPNPKERQVAASVSTKGEAVGSGYDANDGAKAKESNNILARYVAPGRHRPEHMAAAKRVLRYLCSTSGMGLVLGGRSPVVLTGHADASWADDQATQRSSQGYTFSLAEVKGMGKAMFNGADGKMVGLKNVLWVPNLAANLISVRRLQKVGMDTSSKGANTYTARIGERVLWDVHEDRDVYNEMWQVPLVPNPKERQVAASVSTKGEAVGSGYDANDGAKAKESNKCKPGGTSK